MELLTESKKELEINGLEVYNSMHLPIIKEYAARICLVETINRLVDSEMDEEPGIIVLGMILDTLSGRTPLYRLNDFALQHDMELLLGKTISPSCFEDHNVGRVLDKLYETGTTKVFSKIAVRAVDVFNIETKHVSFDTTSRNVFGNYDLYSGEQSKPFRITYGHSKDHRPDLKQFLISMLCVDRNIPVFGKTEDGNKSDKVINNDVLSSVSKYMSAHHLEPGAFIYITDSAMPTKDNLKEIKEKGILFISRLPATYNECNRLIKEAVSKNEWEDQSVIAITKPTAKRPAVRYKTYETETTLHGEKYRAIVVHSNAHDKRRQKKIDRELKREYDALKSRIKVIKKQEFFCEADALKAIDELKNFKKKYYSLNSKVIEIPKYMKGRPKGGIREIREMKYGIETSIEEVKREVEIFRREAGCFVLLTNVPKEGDEGYDSRSILKTYKDQHGIEQNFGFLKDPVIVNCIFLKKAERIEVLGLILLLSLLIWRLIEHSMRKYIDENDADLPGWEKRRTQRPTSFMLTTKFSGVTIVKIRNQRQFSKPLNKSQLEYLNALGLSPSIFIKPGSG
jgi:transposase